MTTNELQLARAFREAGIEQGKAEALSTVIFDAIRDNVATKADIAAVRSDLKLLETSLRGDLASGFLSLRLWAGGALAAAVGVLFTALHYWPPHMTGG